ncbi:MAG TPA: permease-like cell division protein FtsX [Candidatus Paceibacterota bacterium]|nr:permease-like cell division protein FtsX [Candidatus Paceibacterota bacterium]
MFWTKLKRVSRAGFVNFWRNSYVSVASVLVMTITLFVIGLLLFVGVVLNASLAELKNKVDINVYFLRSAAEADILAVKRGVEALPEVEKTEYISREQALAEFRERHKDDQLTLQALDELGENPLGAVLNIKAREVSQYEGIAKFLESKNALSPGGTQIVDRINYAQNRLAIERLTRIIEAARTLGLAVIVIFGLISVLITFNTIRLIVFMSREEISVMRLVGASSMYIRGPFVVEGLMYGAIAGAITLLVFWPLTSWLGPVTENFFSGVNVATYYFRNFFQIFLIIMGSGTFLGVVSSYLAVRRYLKI